MGRFLRGHLGRCKWSVAWRDVADVYLAKRPTLVILETVGAGARKSVCFCDLLRWSVVRQGSSDLAVLTLVRGSTQCHRQKRSIRAGRGPFDFELGVSTNWNVCADQCSVADGWLIDRGRRSVCWFHRDENAWICEPMLFVDLGRGMSCGQPALLKSREQPAPGGCRAALA